MLSMKSDQIKQKYLWARKWCYVLFKLVTLTDFFVLIPLQKLRMLCFTNTKNPELYDHK